MRVQRGQHAGDRRLDELAVVDLVNIAFAHALEDVAKQAKLTIGVLLAGGLRGGECRDRHAGEKQRPAKQGHMPQAQTAYAGPVMHLVRLLRRVHALG